MTQRIFGERTGHVDKIDFDLGLALSLGAVLDTEKNQYYLPLVDECGKSIFIQPEGSDAPEPITRALVVFKQSEPTHTEWDLPSVLLIRDDVTWASQREWSPTESYRLPAPGATPIIVGDTIGYDCYESKPREWPYDFTYTIECWSRYRVVANILVQMVMRAFPPYAKVTVKDSLDNERVYPAFQEGTADLTEVNSLVDRVIGLSMSLRVEGELTLDRIPQIDKSLTGPTLPPTGPGVPGDPGNPGNPYDPFNPETPDLPPGGLYGSGTTCKRVTVEGSDE
jgi:hypothetical protein